MKKQLYILLLCVLSLNLFTACSDDDEGKCTLVDPNLQELTLERLGNTTSTIAFGVTPKMEDQPYICLYIDKKIIDRVPKYDLVDYLMSDLKKQAEREGTPFGEYLASISLTGTQQLQADGLMPGSLYEVVAFGISEEMAADQASCLFMQTALVDKVDCIFGVKVTESTSEFTKFSVTPSLEEESYFFGMVTKEVYDQLSQSYSKGSIFMALFSEQYEEMLMERADEDGYVTEEDIAAVIEEIFWEGSVGLRLSNLEPGTDIVWLAAVFKEVETAEGNQLVVASDIADGTLTFGLDVAPEGDDNVSNAQKIKLGGKTWGSKPYIPMAHPVTQRIN